MSNAKQTLPWHRELIEGVNLSHQAAQHLALAAEDRQAVENESRRFPFLVPKNYAGLVDWQDEHDPLRRLLLPSRHENGEDGAWDTSGEADSLVVPGLQHKYRQTAVILMTQACAGHCRYCFRRRLMDKEVLVRESISDLQPALAYIAKHGEIDNILLSGGDPMVCNTRRLRNLIQACEPLTHIEQIRISTKLPAFLPSRFSSDPELAELLREYQQRFQFVFQCHYDHPRELTVASRQALHNLRDWGCVLTSQVPMLRGVNDDPAVLLALFKELHHMGVMPQYLFHPRPAKHATHFQLPIKRGLAIVEQLRRHCAGPVKRFRYVLAQEDGKIELLGLLDQDGQERLIIRWHQLRRGLDRPTLQSLRLVDDACWLSQADLQ